MLSKIDILTQFLGTSRITDRNGNSYFHCPFCNHHNNKLTINIEKNVYNCFHCDVRGKGLFYLLKKMKVPNLNQYKKIFSNKTQRFYETLSYKLLVLKPFFTVWFPNSGAIFKITIIKKNILSW